MQANKLTLNLQKTHYVVFHKTKKVHLDLTIKIDNYILNRKSNTKFLGLHLQEDLKWDIHINSLITKMNKCIHLFITLKDFLTNKQSITAYNAIVFSKYNYGIELHGKCNNF